MMHSKRPHQIATASTPQEIHDKLKRFSWTLCTGFRWKSLLLLNDSTSEDAIQEYGLIKLAPGREDQGIQIDSLTVSWMKQEEFVAFLEKAEAEEYGTSAFSYGPWEARVHGDGRTCSRCA